MDVTDQTCRDLFDLAIKRYEDRVAVTFKGRDRTYEEIGDEMLQVGRALDDLGMRRGDRVALLMSNRPEYLTSDLGIVRSGYIEVPLNDMLSEDEIKYMLNDTTAGAIIVGPNFIDTIDEIRDEIESLDIVLAITDGYGGDLPDGFLDYGEYLSRFSTEFYDTGVDPEDPAYLVFTGGTTGRPKPVRHSHSNWVQNLYMYAIEFEFSEGEQMLLSTPLAHATGYALRTGLLRGARGVITQGFDVEQTLELIENEGITWTFMVPTMIYRILDHPDLEAYDTSSLRTVLYGGSPITPDRLEEGFDALGPVFLQTYGQTEVLNIITTLSKREHVKALEEDPERLTSCGQETLMSDVRIVDDEWNTLPPDESGEIAVRAPYVMDEYWGKPAQTIRDVQNGWKRTGDVGKKDEDGFVYLLDRKSDMIVSGGMNVYSPDVEEVVATHGSVAQVAVIGVPDPDWGEAVTAVVVPYDEENVSEQEIIDHTRGKLADYKRPKSVDFVTELPETPYGKIDKTALRDRYWDETDRQIH